MSVIMDVLNKVKEETGQSSTVGEVTVTAERKGMSTIVPAHVLEFSTADGMKRKTERSVSTQWLLMAALAAILAAIFAWYASTRIVNYWNLESQVQNKILDNIGRTQDLLSVLLGKLGSVNTGFLTKGSLWQEEVLEGIIVDPVNPICLIGSDIYHIGDYWKGKKIVSIKHDRVTLTDRHGKTFILKPKFSNSLSRVRT